MAILHGTLETPGGTPLAGASVRIRARSSLDDPTAPVYLGDSTIVGEATATTNSDGEWLITMRGSDAYDPPNSWLEVTYWYQGRQLGPAEAFTLPDDDGVYAIGTRKIDQPAALPDRLYVLGTAGTNIYIPPGWATWKVLRDADGRTHEVYHGDSIVLGLATTDGGWVRYTRDAINHGTPPSPGFQMAYSGQWTFAGSWDYPDVDTQWDRALQLVDSNGAGLLKPAVRIASEQADIATYTLASTEPDITSLDVFTLDAVFATLGEYSIDGGSWTAIPAPVGGAYSLGGSDDAAIRRHRITGITAGTTIRLRGPASGLFYLLGITPYYTARGGVVVHQVARNGASLGSIFGAGDSDRFAMLGGATPAGSSIVPGDIGGLLVTDFMGADLFDGGDLDEYRTRVETYIETATARGWKVLWVTPNDFSAAFRSANGIGTTALAEATAIVENACRAKGAAFVSIAQQWGAEATVHDTFMFYDFGAFGTTDGGHPGVLGHQDIARIWLAIRNLV